MKRAPIYAWYQGDEFLFEATMREAAQRFNCSLASFRFRLTPTYRKRVSDKKHLTKVLLEGGMEDECDSQTS